MWQTRCVFPETLSEMLCRSYSTRPFRRPSPPRKRKTPVATPASHRAAKPGQAPQRTAYRRTWFTDRPWLKKESYPKDKTDTLDHYRSLTRTPFFYILQHNHLSAQEWTPIRSALQKAGLQLTCVKGSLFRAMLKQSPVFSPLIEPCMAGGIAVVRPMPMNSSNTTTPAAAIASAPKGAKKPQKAEEDDKEAAWQAFRATAGLAPERTKKMLQILKREGGDKLVLVGGSIEEELMGPNRLLTISKMPSRSTLHSQLVGLLQQPAMMLAATLQQTPQMLALTLEAHQKKLSDQQK